MYTEKRTTIKLVILYCQLKILVETILVDVLSKTIVNNYKKKKMFSTVKI